MINFVKRGFLASLLLSLSCIPVFGDPSLPSIKLLKEELEIRAKYTPEEMANDPYFADEEFRWHVIKAGYDIRRAAGESDEIPTGIVTLDDIAVLESGSKMAVALAWKYKFPEKKFLWHYPRYGAGSALTQYFKLLHTIFKRSSSNSGLQNAVFDAAHRSLHFWLSVIWKTQDEVKSHRWDIAPLPDVFEMFHAMDCVVQKTQRRIMDTLIPFIIVFLQKYGDLCRSYYKLAPDTDRGNLIMLALLDQLPEDQKVRDLAKQAVNNPRLTQSEQPAEMAAKLNKVRALLTR